VPRGHRTGLDKRLDAEASRVTSHGFPESRQGRWWNVDFFPVSLFGSVMGLTGLSAAWRIAHEQRGAPAWPAVTTAAVAIAAFCVITLTYALKMITSPKTVLAEYRHHVQGCLFGTIFVSLLLLPFVVEEYSMRASLLIWAVGTAGMIVFAFAMIGRWLSAGQLEQHVTPVWIIPIVGLLDVPLAMPSLGLSSYRELMVFSLTIGLFFTVPIFTMVFQRLVFEKPGVRFEPTLFILMAPFAVGYSAYDAVTGANDLFAQSLFMLTLFLLAVFMIHSRGILQRAFRSPPQASQH
jgi:tellurite resistance protein